MTYLVERLSELRRHLDHLREIRPRVTGREALERDLSLHNDVLFSLLTVCQLVIDVAGDLAARRGDRFEDYTAAGGRAPQQLATAGEGATAASLLRRSPVHPRLRSSASAFTAAWRYMSERVG